MKIDDVRICWQCKQPLGESEKMGMVCGVCYKVKTAEEYDSNKRKFAIEILSMAVTHE
jgi:uncharacterized CHY-type Zn-finger protein